MVLSGKVSVVTASTAGIGFAIAKNLLEKSCKVVISSRKENNVTSALNALKSFGDAVIGTTCHVGISEDRKNLIKLASEKFGRLDILVLNAAVNPYFGSLLECPESVWKKLFEVNVVSSALMTSLALPEFEKVGSGSVVLVSSIGAYNPITMLGPYCVTKTALLGLTKNLALECAPYNVRVNCVAPGIIKTKFSQALHSNKELSNIILERIPMKRFGEPEDVAGTVSFLCSDEAKYITGETIVLSGGMDSHL